MIIESGMWEALNGDKLIIGNKNRCNKRRFGSGNVSHMAECMQLTLVARSVPDNNHTYILLNCPNLTLNRNDNYPWSERRPQNKLSTYSNIHSIKDKVIIKKKRFYLKRYTDLLWDGWGLQSIVISIFLVWNA